MRSFLIFFILVWAVGLNAQQPPSLMYNSMGQLRADTSLSIGPEQLERWVGIEKLLLRYVVATVRFSDMAIENKVNGRMICSFDVDSLGSIGSFQLISGPGYGMYESIGNKLKSYQLIQSLANANAAPWTYYIAVDLQFVNAAEYLEREGAIPLIGNSLPVIQY